MRKSDQISLRLSEARSAQNVAARELGTLLDIAEPEKPEEHRALVTKANTELRTRQADVDKYETEWRDARQTEIEAGDTEQRTTGIDGEPDAELRELMSINKRASIGTYIDAIANDQPLTGAEDELRQAWGATHGMIPWSLLDPSLNGVPEERADANISTPSTLPAHLGGIVGRVFTRSSTMFLGIRPTPVPPGDRLYFVVTDGPTAEFKAAEASKDAADLTLTPKSLKPGRLAVRYSMKLEDLARIGEAFEPAVRADATGALATAMDKSTLVGGSSPDLPGLLNANADPTNPSAVVTFASAAATLGGQIDGTYAATMKDLRIVAGTGTNTKLESLIHAGSGETAAEVYTRRTGGYRVSAHMPAMDATTKIAKAVVGPHGRSGQHAEQRMPGVERRPDSDRGPRNRRGKRSRQAHVDDVEVVHRSPRGRIRHRGVPARDHLTTYARTAAIGPAPNKGRAIFL